MAPYSVNTLLARRGTARCALSRFEMSFPFRRGAVPAPAIVAPFCQKRGRVTLPLLLLGVFFFASSCIYSFKGTGGALVESIAVEQLENKTTQAGIADRVTELVVDALLADGRIEVVSPSTAESILSGALTGYRRTPKAFDENDQVSEYAVTLTVELTLTKRESEQEIWKETFSQEGTYSVADETEEDGQSRATDLIVTDILNKTTRSDW